MELLQPMNSFQVRCAWCSTELWPAHPDTATPAISHGICLDCVVREFNVPIETFDAIAPEKLDASPFGIVLLDLHGCILQYNQYESNLSGRPRESVLGQNFFTDVAPCTAVKEFKGRFDELVRSGAGEESFSFIFAFPGRKTYVNIRLQLAPGNRTVVTLVKNVSEQISSCEEQMSS